MLVFHGDYFSVVLGREAMKKRITEHVDVLKFSTTAESY